MLDTMELGLGESLLMLADRGTGMERVGAEDKYPGGPASEECVLVGESAHEGPRCNTRRSSIAESAGAAERPSYGRPFAPNIDNVMSESVRPCSCSNDRSFRFSSKTLLAAFCISAEASIPACSQLRSLPSSSLMYSFLLARDRPINLSILCSRLGEQRVRTYVGCL